MSINYFKKGELGPTPIIPLSPLIPKNQLLAVTEVTAYIKLPLQD